MSQTSNSPELSKPPRPPLAFRVGIVGHRPDRLKNADLEQLSAVLANFLSFTKKAVRDAAVELKDLYDDKQPVILTALSPLAEGTDRLFAKAAGEDYALCCVMPFIQAEYEKDFASNDGEAASATTPGEQPKGSDKKEQPTSLEEFRGLLTTTKTRFELDGCREDEGAAYGAAGRVVLNQSDILFVVWDGERQGKRGGTEETFDEARSAGVPIIWIDAHAPHTSQLLTGNDKIPKHEGRAVPVPGETDLTEGKIKKVVMGILDLTKPAQHPEPSDHDHHPEDPKADLLRFYSEQFHSWSRAVVWKIFRDLVGDGKFPRFSFKVEPFEKAVESDWPRDTTSPIAKTVDHLRPYYAWPDQLAALYANRFRSAFILAFLLSACAVAMALAPYGFGLIEHSEHDAHGSSPITLEALFTGAELITIISMLSLIALGLNKQWHERWLDYRIAAELVRHLRLVIPLGGSRPFAQVQAHHATYGQPSSMWMNWYVRAVHRSIGLPSTVVDNAYLRASVAHLETLLNKQLEFHQGSFTRSHSIEHQLHRIGMGSLYATLACCVLHLMPCIHPITWIPPLLTFFCGALPAFGAALAGINNQGEFKRSAKRSKAMCAQLRPLLDDTTNLRKRLEEPSTGCAPLSSEAVSLVSRSAGLLVNEVLDWRVVFLDRPLTPPA